MEVYWEFIKPMRKGLLRLRIPIHLPWSFTLLILRAPKGPIDILCILEVLSGAATSIEADTPEQRVPKIYIECCDIPTLP